MLVECCSKRAVWRMEHGCDPFGVEEVLLGAFRRRCRRLLGCKASGVGERRAARSARFGLPRMNAGARDQEGSLVSDAGGGLPRMPRCEETAEGRGPLGLLNDLIMCPEPRALPWAIGCWAVGPIRTSYPPGGFGGANLIRSIRWTVV
jgi:hypothetical protein